MATTITSAELEAEVVGQTVATRFADTVRRNGSAVALRAKVGDDWVETTFEEYARSACRVAAALTKLGIGRGDHVALFMRNMPEFHIADMGVVLAGATPFSIYNSSSPEEVAYLLGHSEAKVVIAEDIGFLSRVIAVRSELSELRTLVIIDPSDAPADAVLWSEIMNEEPVDLEAASIVVQPSDLATIIYTSGTTGPPKGVMIDHANVCFTAESLRMTWDIDLAGRRIVSYLPMAHIAERMVSHYQNALLGVEVTACPDPGRIAQYLTEVRPEILFAVPRIWEKVYGAIQSMVAGDTEKKNQLDYAIDLGWQVSECTARDEQPSDELAAKYEQVAPALNNLRAMIGMDHCMAAVTGAAPIPYEIFRFFRGLGVPLSEIYGLSETSGPMTWTPVRIKAGTVGPAIAGCEVKLAEDGEVICRGGNVFKGYLKEPEKTAEAVVDGWFHSGDIGVFDEDGYLSIVDRKKELIITAGGKNISPANIEAALKAHPLIGQACVIGDQRAYLVALIVLDPEVAPAWAKQRGIETDDLEQLALEPAVREEVQRGVDAANELFARVEQIKKFALFSHEWMPGSEELTPTMKLKRRGIHARYADEIEALYG